MNLWHNRLRHPSFERLKLLCNSFDYMHFPSHFHCSVCPMAKQTRLAYNKSSISSTAPFQLIHVDIWGPFFLPRTTGARYFLTIIDDFFHCTWLYLMQAKSETLKFIKYFHASIITKFSKSIGTISTRSTLIHLPVLQEIRTDNGSEFLSRDFQSWLLANDIHHQRSCVSNPQQNGVVERKHRHPLNVARALRFQSNIPLQYWGECLSLIKFQHPFFRTNRLMKLLLVHLRIILYSVFSGVYVIYAQNTHVVHKFDARAHPGIFIGYPSNHKGYKILDIKTKKIYVSRDVIFHEDLFPFQDALSVQSDFLLSHDSSESLYDHSDNQPIQCSSNNHSSTPEVSSHNSSSGLSASKCLDECLFTKFGELT